MIIDLFSINGLNFNWFPATGLTWHVVRWINKRLTLPSKASVIWYQMTLRSAAAMWSQLLIWLYLLEFSALRPSPFHISEVLVIVLREEMNEVGGSAWGCFEVCWNVRLGQGTRGICKIEQKTIDQPNPKALMQLGANRQIFHDSLFEVFEFDSRKEKCWNAWMHNKSVGVFICAQCVWEKDDLCGCAVICSAHAQCLFTIHFCALQQPLLQNPLLQSKNINKLFISSHAKLILLKLVLPNMVCGPQMSLQTFKARSRAK